MKILISEKQADRIFNEKIECEKCENSWKKDNNDSHQYLCHDCGWDQKKEKCSFPILHQESLCQ